MAGPTFCPHSFACWGEIAQRWGCGYCRRRMSVTMQRKTLAFYDYCLCVPPLKAEWGELSVRHFWLAARWLASSRKGCIDIFLLWRGYSDPMPKPRGLRPTATARLKWNLRARSLSQTQNHVYQVCRDNKGFKLCRICRFATEFQHYSMKEISTDITWRWRVL